MQLAGGFVEIKGAKCANACSWEHPSTGARLDKMPYGTHILTFKDGHFRCFSNYPEAVEWHRTNKLGLNQKN